MKYTVTWSRRAEQVLAAIWMRASDRYAVTRAARLIDRALKTNPLDIGESRESGRRIHFEAPLGIACSVRQHDMLVRARRVWKFRIRGE